MTGWQDGEEVWTTGTAIEDDLGGLTRDQRGLRRDNQHWPHEALGVTHWSLDSELSVDGGEKCGPDGEFDKAEHCDRWTVGSEMSVEGDENG